jgi:hypothetical protein
MRKRVVKYTLEGGEDPFSWRAEGWPHWALNLKARILVREAERKKREELPILSRGQKKRERHLRKAISIYVQGEGPRPRQLDNPAHIWALEFEKQVRNGTVR